MDEVPFCIVIDKKKTGLATANLRSVALEALNDSCDLWLDDPNELGPIQQSGNSSFATVSPLETSYLDLNVDKTTAPSISIKRLLSQGLLSSAALVSPDMRRFATAINDPNNTSGHNEYSRPIDQVSYIDIRRNSMSISEHSCDRAPKTVYRRASIGDSCDRIPQLVHRRYSNESSSHHDDVHEETMAPQATIEWSSDKCPKAVMRRESIN